MQNKVPRNIHVNLQVRLLSGGTKVHCEYLFSSVTQGYNFWKRCHSIICNTVIIFLNFPEQGTWEEVGKVQTAPTSDNRAGQLTGKGYICSGSQPLPGRNLWFWWEPPGVGSSTTHLPDLHKHSSYSLWLMPLPQILL